jgi:hypothetical protein
MEHRETVCTGIANIIRDSSASGHLVRAQEILSELHGRGALESVDSEQERDLETVLQRVLQENQDLVEISGRTGHSYYYSARSMSDTYAGILVKKSEDPLWLIAEVVREHSKLYPSPVPLDRFTESPFDLSREAIFGCLEAFGEETEYQDIEQTITSAGTTFLYSSRHLDPDYAAMLAEWTDVGQAGNP